MINDLVSVVIVNFNGLSHLKKCLASIYNQDYKKIEIILVDNGSSDGSVEWARTNFKAIKIIENKKNLGFCKPNNIGYRASRGEYVLFLNNDTKVKKDFLIKLLAIFEKDENVGGLQSKILFMDNPAMIDSVGSFLTVTGFLYHYGIFSLDSKRFDKSRNIYSAKGACMMFRRKVLEEILVKEEVFDSRYFAYFEETDLCHRVWLTGYKVVSVPGSIIYHKFGATSSRLKRAFIEFHSYKNRINTYVKNLGFARLCEILPLHIALSLGISIYYLLKGKLDLFLAIQKAISWNLVELRETILRRRFIQKRIRKVKDDIIFPQIYARPPLKYYLGLLKGPNVLESSKK